MSKTSDYLPDVTLVVRAGPYGCALPLTCVAETMRPLPIQPVANMPAFVRGISVIRGQPVPVVDLAALLGGAESTTGRFVVVRVEQRTVALAVDEVTGIREPGAVQVAAVPPLLQEARPDQMAALGAVDEKLLIVLSTTRILPGEVWEGLAK